MASVPRMPPSNISSPEFGGSTDAKMPTSQPASTTPPRQAPQRGGALNPQQVPALPAMKNGGKVKVPVKGKKPKRKKS